MAFFIGVDGGGTKTHCVLADSSLNVLHECIGGPSNFLVLGTETASNNIFSAISECLNIAKLDYAQISSLVLGISGAGRISDANKLKEDFTSFCESKGAALKNIHVESDARIALEGAFSGDSGSILISGTGSIMFGKDPSGNIHRTGGFGRFIGDEGSGYSIGKKGLSAAARAFDGRGGKTLLTRLLAEKFHINTAEELIIAVYKYNFDISSAAQLVLKTAEQSDPACLVIIEEETNELMLHILTMAEKLNEPVMRVAFIGSLISNDNIFSRVLLNKMKDRPQNIQVHKPDHSPAIGAVIMAKKYSE